MGVGSGNRPFYPTARFDEGEQANMARFRLVRYRQTKGAATDRPRLRAWQPALYSTLFDSGSRLVTSIDGTVTNLVIGLVKKAARIENIAAMGSE